MPILSVKNLQVNYEQHTVLKQVSFDIDKNECIGIIGPNGGGKTTLVKTLLGLLRPTAGSIHISKGEVMGYVPQYTTFDRRFPITVRDVILTGHLPKRMKLAKRFQEHEKQHALSVMERLGIENLKNRQIGTLSGGQMQRVLIARALMNHPTILILDEPTAGVDDKAKTDIYRMLKELLSSVTILMITHDTADFMKLFDRVIYMNKTVHIHDNAGRVKPDHHDICPIDWFVEGEKIQDRLMEEKGEKS